MSNTKEVKDNKVVKNLKEKEKKGKNDLWFSEFAGLTFKKIFNYFENCINIILFVFFITINSWNMKKIQ
jgi:hypothetical protein